MRIREAKANAVARDAVIHGQEPILGKGDKLGDRNHLAIDYEFREFVFYSCSRLKSPCLERQSKLAKNV
jgi:hypothetical protein